MRTMLEVFGFVGIVAGFIFGAVTLYTMFLKYASTTTAIVNTAIYAEATAYAVLSVAAFCFSILCEVSMWRMKYEQLQRIAAQSTAQPTS